jgi:pyruvate/2-oxoglutarate dehydrogenase complex dihydrolipoamide acyltransferase (E2) component
MNKSVGYSARPWPPLRNAVETVLQLHRPYTNWGFSEADVTLALSRISQFQRQLKCAVSFHAFIIYCLAQAAKKNPNVLCFRYGKQLITFDDADVATVIDKRFAPGVRLPAVYTVRAAQNKSLAEINYELRQAIRTDQSHTEAVKLRQGLTRKPWFIRRLVGWWMSRNPFVLRKYHGTIGVTSLRTQGFDRPFVALAPNIYTMTVAVGTIAERVCKNAQGEFEARKILCLSAGADHLVIDGAPLASFAQCFIGLIESAAGLDENFIAQSATLLRGGSDE